MGSGGVRMVEVRAVRLANEADAVISRQRPCQLWRDNLATFERGRDTERPFHHSGRHPLTTYDISLLHTVWLLRDVPQALSETSHRHSLRHPAGFLQDTFQNVAGIRDIMHLPSSLLFSMASSQSSLERTINRPTSIIKPPIKTRAL